MNLGKLQQNWNEFGKTDPLWSILTSPDKKGNKWQIDDFFKTGVHEIEEIMRYSESFNINFFHRKALDFGCGVGRLTQALGNYFCEVYGVDIASSMIELAKKYNTKGNKCIYFLNESNDLGLFENNSFDFIYSNIVLQHMKPEYSKNYIKEFIRVLVPGGIAIFQIPSEIKFPSDQSYITTSLPDSGFKAEITINEPPSIMETYSQTILSVNIKNISNNNWPVLGDKDGNYQIKLGNHWLDNNKKIIINDEGRTNLPKCLKPGDEVKLSLVITAPKKPGTYILELDMVQEMISWFKDKGSETLRLNIEAVRPININGNQNVTHSEEINPTMEMYGVQKNKIINLIKENGGILVDIQDDLCAGKEWLGFRYCITK